MKKMPYLAGALISAALLGGCTATYPQPTDKLAAERAAAVAEIDALGEEFCSRYSSIIVTTFTPVYLGILPFDMAWTSFEAASSKLLGSYGLQNAADYPVGLEQNMHAMIVNVRSLVEASGRLVTSEEVSEALRINTNNECLIPYQARTNRLKARISQMSYDKVRDVRKKMAKFPL